MKANHLAVIFPAKGLPQNTDQAYSAVWAETSRLLLRDLGILYASFYPAAHTWGIDIRAPYGVVLGRDDPARFLRLFSEARVKQACAIEYHVGGTLAETGLERFQAAGDMLICPVILDGTNKRLESHVLWHMALASGAILPDCGVYYAEQKRSTVDPGLEKNIESNPVEYALCMVTLELMEGQT